MDFYTLALALGLGYVSLALGIYISMRIINLPDITTDGSFTLGAAVSATMLYNEMPAYLCTLIAPIAGAFAGIATGIIHTRLRINALLSGIIVMTALYSINLLIMSQTNIPLINFSTLFSNTFIQNNFSYKLVLLIAISLFLIFSIYYFLSTDYGIAMRALGNSEQMLRSVGVNTNRMKITGLAIANSLSALSGSLIAQYQGFADINMGIGIVITALGSVMIGEAIVSFFSTENILFRIAGVAIGALLFRLILAFALAAGLNPNYLKLITALMVLFIVGLAGVGKKQNI